METVANNNKGLNISLWVAQVLLAIGFLLAGIMKSFQPIEELGKSLPWVIEVPAALVRFIGISEFLGALALLFPSILRVQPKLTVWAAVGIATIMLFALVYHVAKGEMSVIGINILFGLMAGFVAWGRAKKVVITAKN